MRCDEFAERLDYVLDQRRDPAADPLLRKHARACLNCRDEMETIQTVLTGIDLWESPAANADLAQRVVAQVVAEDGRRPWYLHAWRGWALAAAAMLLVSVLPAYWLAKQNDRQTAAANAWSAPRHDSLAQANTSASSIESNTISSPWSYYGASIWQLYPASARERHRQQVSDIADDLKPLATSFNAAVSAIRRTLPGGRNPDRMPSRTSRLSPDRSGVIS